MQIYTTFMLEGAAEVLALADALRTPLLRMHFHSQSVSDSATVRVITEHALRDIDAFISSYSEATAAQISLEPIALGSILVDTEAKLKSYAGLAGTVLRVDDHSTHQLVIGNANILQIGLELITKTICDFASDTPEPSVILRADTRHGYPRLGVYRSDIELSARDVALARKLIGGAQVNAGVFQQLGALRVIIAGRLLDHLGLTLRSAKANGGRGLALQLRPSSQASLFGA